MSSRALLRLNRSRLCLSFERRSCQGGFRDHVVTRREFGTTTSDKNNNDDEWQDWIPPNRPLAGDKGQSHLYPMNNTDDDDVDEEELELKRIEEQLRVLEEQEAREQKQQQQAAAVAAAMAMSDAPPSVDWLQTRRQVLQEETEALDMLPPDQARSLKDQLGEIPVKKHTLLSKDEIASCLEALGGRDIKVILDLERRMGGALGIIIASASTRTQLRVLAETLVRQLRRRQLEEMNVIGAQLGPEGSGTDETWWVVDCRNYVVHLQDERTRRAVDLEGLWTGKDGLHLVDPLNEEEVDDYVAENPVPDDFGGSIFELGDTLKKLQKSRWTAKHNTVIPKRKKQGKRRKN